MRNQRILVIEDDALNLKLVESLLEIGRYHILKAMDAESGIQMMQQERPDLVLMDIRLPGMDGLRATQLIKKDPELKNIPVIALTAQAMLGDEEEAAEAGCDGYITKPIDTRRFLATLENFLGQDKQKSGTSRGIHRDRREKILVVDDEPLNVKLLTAKLSSVGYEVIEAYSGQEGLEKVAAEYPDLVLLDVMMPFMDGFEVTRILKQDPHTCHIPIILVTALDASENKSKGLEAGADDFLNKPINNIELQARVRSLLELKRYRDLVSQQKEAKQQLGRLAQQQGSHMGRERIPTLMLVEDSETDAKIIQCYLEKESLQIQLCTSGDTAMKRAKEGNLDLILLDVLLPDINGFEICRMLKEEEETKDIQILMVTCLGDLESKTKGIELGADDYLVKPIDEKELKARIKTLLEKKCHLDSLTSKDGTDDICAIQGKLGGKENQVNATTPGAMEPPQPVTEACSSVETSENVESRKKQDPMAATLTSFSTGQSGPADVSLDRNALDQIVELERRGASKSLLETLVNTYLDTTPVLLERLHKVARQDNPRALRETAHRLQSSSANLGALTLADLCRELEVRARENSTRNAVEMVSHIEREYEKVRHGLTQVLKTRNLTE